MDIRFSSDPGVPLWDERMFLPHALTESFMPFMAMTKEVCGLLPLDILYSCKHLDTNDFSSSSKNDRSFFKPQRNKYQ